jgi:hypothetical protein
MRNQRGGYKARGDSVVATPLCRRACGRVWHYGTSTERGGYKTRGDSVVATPLCRRACGCVGSYGTSTERGGYKARRGKVVATPLCRRACGCVGQSSAVETAVPGQNRGVAGSWERRIHSPAACWRACGCVGSCGTSTERGGYKARRGKVVATPLCRRACGCVGQSSAVETAVPGQNRGVAASWERGRRACGCVGSCGTSTERGGYNVRRGKVVATPLCRRACGRVWSLRHLDRARWLQGAKRKSCSHAALSACLRCGWESAP